MISDCCLEDFMVESSGNIRLSVHDLEALKSCFRKHFLPSDRLWIFGSRAKPHLKGGDIDLYVETHAATLEEAAAMQLHFLFELEEKIGEQKIDVVLNLLNHPHPLPIYDIAKNEGVNIL